MSIHQCSQIFDLSGKLLMETKSKFSCECLELLHEVVIVIERYFN